MFRDFRIEGRPALITEYGIFSPALNRWLSMQDGRVSFFHDGAKSLRDSFPHPDAGSEHFAHMVREALTEGQTLFDQYEVDISEYGISTSAVSSVKVRRAQMISTGLEIQEYEHHHHIFDMRGDPRLMMKWESEYRAHHPNAIVTRLVKAPKCLVRVLERTSYQTH